MSDLSLQTLVVISLHFSALVYSPTLLAFFVKIDVVSVSSLPCLFAIPLCRFYRQRCGQRWTTFVLARADVQTFSSAGIRLKIYFVSVAHLHRRCCTLWTIVRISLWNFPEVCQLYIWLMRRLLPGSAFRAHAKKNKQVTSGLLICML